MAFTSNSLEKVKKGCGECYWAQSLYRKIVREETEKTKELEKSGQVMDISQQQAFASKKRELQEESKKYRLRIMNFLRIKAPKSIYESYNEICTGCERGGFLSAGLLRKIEGK